MKKSNYLTRKRPLPRLHRLRPSKLSPRLPRNIWKERKNRNRKNSRTFPIYKILYHYVTTWNILMMLLRKTSSTSLGDPPRALNKSSSSRPATQSAENVCYRSNIFVLGETKTTASLLYLQNLKRMRYLIYSKKQKSNCSKFSLRDPHVMFNPKV